MKLSNLNIWRLNIDLKQEKKNFQNLEIAELKANIVCHEERYNILIKQLEELDEDQDIMDLKDRLEENSSLLKGYFEDEKQRLEKQKDLLENQKYRYEDELREILKDK